MSTGEFGELLSARQLLCLPTKFWCVHGAHFDYIAAFNFAVHNDLAAASFCIYMHGVDEMSVAARDPAQMNVCSTNMREFHLVLPPLRCRCLSPCPHCLRCSCVVAVVLV